MTPSCTHRPGITVPAAPTSHFVQMGRILRSLLHIGKIFFFSKRPDPRTKDAFSRWFESFLGILGVEVKTTGERPASTACLIVSNHTSWIDIFVIRTLFSTCFIAKEEIAKWPLVGPISQQAGTIFIGRNRLSSFRETLKASRHSLSHNVPITVFPEGTTTIGDRMLPFKTGVFDLCTETGYPALPVSIRYETPEGDLMTSVSYSGDENIFCSFRRTLMEPRVVVRVHISPLISPEGLDRRTMAGRAQEAVANGLSLLTESGGTL